MRSYPQSLHSDKLKCNQKEFINLKHLENSKVFRSNRELTYHFNNSSLLFCPLSGLTNHSTNYAALLEKNKQTKTQARMLHLNLHPRITWPCNFNFIAIFQTYSSCPQFLGIQMIRSVFFLFCFMKTSLSKILLLG